MTCFKPYHNPLYEHAADGDWQNGYCGIFAHALHERFGLPIWAWECVDYCLIHAAVMLPDGRLADSNGIRTKEEIEAGLFLEEFMAFRPVTLADLQRMNPEDIEATNAAHRYIETNPARFAALGHPLPQLDTAATQA